MICSGTQFFRVHLPAMVAKTGNFLIWNLFFYGNSCCTNCHLIACQTIFRLSKTKQFNWILCRYFSASAYHTKRAGKCFEKCLSIAIPATYKPSRITTLKDLLRMTPSLGQDLCLHRPWKTSQGSMDDRRNFSAERDYWVDIDIGLECTHMRCLMTVHDT